MKFSKSTKVLINVSIILCLISTAFYSCEEEDNSFGTQFFTGTSFEFSTWDTLSVKMSTVILDSLPTNNYERLLIGNHSDPYFGHIESIPYFQVGLDSIYDLNMTDYKYDSITIVLNYEDYYYYDSSEIQTLEVYRLKEDIELEDNGLLYNTSSFELSEVPVGITSFAPRPNSEAVIEIRLDDALGLEIFDSKELNTDVLTDATEFLSEIKGFALKSIAERTSFIGLSPTAQLRIYYSDFSVIPFEQDYLTFSMGGTYYNQIISDKSNTFLSDINNQEEEVKSEESENLCFMQGGTGVAIKMELPYLKNLLLNNTEFFIEDVFIKLFPKLPDSNSTEFLPIEIAVYQIDHNNDIYSSQEAVIPLTFDTELDRDTYYEINITDFVEGQLDIAENNENALLITLPWAYYSSTISQLIVGDQEHNELEVIVNLNLINLKK